MRGFNDFNKEFEKELSEIKTFPSPCGVLMILIYDDKDRELVFTVSVPMRGFNDFN